MFGYASKQDAAQQEADQAQWRAEVMSTRSTGATRWKPLQDWEAVYEPPQQPKQQSTAQSYMAAKAKQMLVNKVQRSVSAKMMTIAQESSSKVLTRAEQEATQSQLKNESAKKKKTWDILASLLNNLNAVILTFRFERDEKTKCQYLRQVASDALADTLQKLFETAEDAGEHIDEMRIQITNVIESQKDKVKEFVETSLDEALQEVLANAEEKTTKNVAQAKKQLADTAGETISTLDKVAGMNAEVMDPTTKEKIQELESSIKRQKVEIQDESVSMLSDCIKLLVLKKMDKLTILLVFAIDKLLDAVQELYKTATEYQLDQRQLHTVVLHAIETFHKTFQSKVSLDVQRAVAVLESIMENSGDNEDE